jgi:hypothetical protein
MEWSAAVSKTSRSSQAKPACWNSPDTANLVNVLRLVLCTQPRSQIRNLKTKPMIDLIFIAVISLFFVAGGLYACWCEKL